MIDVNFLANVFITGLFVGCSIALGIVLYSMVRHDAEKQNNGRA